MSILDNAINSIKTGVDDYSSTDSKRNISAVRNVFAGIILLYKKKLCMLSPSSDPELLIKKTIRPCLDSNGDLIFRGVGKKTVDVQEIKTRFKDFNIEVDWNRFDKLNELRNNVEHYYSEVPNSIVEEILTKSILLVTEFIKKELNENPEKLLGRHCWRSLMHIGEVYEQEKEECVKTLGKIDWKYGSISANVSSFQCPACNSDLISASNETDIYPDINLNCKSCNAEFYFHENIEFLIEYNYLDFQKDGQIRRLRSGRCGDCGQRTFLYSEDECIICGSNYELELHCSICGCSLSSNVKAVGDVCESCRDVIGDIV